MKAETLTECRKVSVQRDRNSGLPRELRQAINQAAHRLARVQYERLRLDLLAEAAEQFDAGVSINEIKHAVCAKAFARQGGNQC